MSYLEISHIIQWFFLLALIFLVYKLIQLLGKTINIFENKGKPAYPSLKYSKEKLTPILGESLTTNKKVDSSYEFTENNLLFFISPGCVACRELINNIHEFTNTELNIIFISNDADTSQLSFYIEQLSKHNIPFLVSDNIMKENEIPVAPFAILVNQDLLVKKYSVASNVNLVKNMLEEKNYIKNAI